MFMDISFFLIKGGLKHHEEEVISYFSDDPSAIMISTVPSRYELANSLYSFSYICYKTIKGVIKLKQLETCCFIQFHYHRSNCKPRGCECFKLPILLWVFHFMRNWKNTLITKNKTLWFTSWNKTSIPMAFTWTCASPLTVKYYSKKL